MTPAALLLDLDGTLVDTEPLNRAAYRAFFAGRGWEAPDLALFTGRRAEDVFAAEPGPWAGEDLLALSREVIGLIDPDAVPEPLPGAAELLAAAAEQGIPVAIVTSAGPDWVRRAAIALPGLDRVDLVVTALDVVDGKPDPTCYRLACERLAVDPATTMAVEDSAAGVQSASAAGVGTVIDVTQSDLRAVIRLIGG